MTKFGVYRQVFLKVHNTKFHWNSSSVSRAETSGQMDRCTDGQRDMTNLIGVFSEYANAPKNYCPTHSRKSSIKNCSNFCIPSVIS